METSVRVLLADDDEDEYVLTRDRLTEAKGVHFDLERVASYEAALETIMQARHDAYLVDYRLGERDGLELLRAAVAAGCTAPIILLTRQGDREVDLAAMEAGAAGLLDKSQLSAPLLERSIRCAVGRKRGEEALRQRSRDLALLNQVCQDLTATLDLEQVIKRLLQAVTEIIGTQGVSVWLRNGEQDESLVCRAAFPHDMARPLVDLRLQPGQGVAGWVAQSGESAIVVDVLQDPRFFPGVDEQTGFHTSSLLAVPLWVGDAVVGVLEAVNKSGSSFNENDLALAETLATRAAIAIENAALHQSLLGHRDHLEEIVKQRTAEVQTQHARLEAILRSASDGIVVANAASGEIVEANPIARDWLDRALSPEDAAQLQETLRDVAMRAQEIPKVTLELAGLDLELSAAPVTESGERHFSTAVVSIHDISHLKALDRMKTRFVTNVSHELRTPITTIKLYAELMQERPQRWQEYLPALLQEVDRQARLVEDILEISHIDAGRMEIQTRWIPLDELAESAVHGHEALAQDQGLELSLRPEGTGLAVVVDAERMLQVLSNLLSNAIRYTPEGGKVTVSTGRKEKDGRAWAIVSVADTGMGIPQEDLPHVFERFFRGEKPQSMQISGTGLGLAIAEEIVELHGGRVTVESKVGEGSTFTVWLSLAE